LFYDIRDQRGNLGTFRLEPGVSIPGTVVSFDGKAVPNVGVELKSLQADPSGASRHTRADANGKFVFKPVRPGFYKLKVSGTTWDEKTETVQTTPLPAAFVDQEIIARYTPDNKFPPVEIRAVQHVTIDLQYVDSSGKPRSGHPVDLFGQRGNEGFIAEGDPDANYRIQIFAPKGLTNTKINMSTDPYSAICWRRGANGELSLNSPRQIDLGTLNDDVKDLFIVRYDAPVLVLRAVGPDGKPLADYQPAVTYAGRAPSTRGAKADDDGDRDVHFERQDDGSWRSEQLLPDVEVNVGVKANGYSALTQKITLKEKETREMTVSMRKNP
jgi:hypothetical protein